MRFSFLASLAGLFLGTITASAAVKAPAVAPTITVNPAPLTVTAGAKATFSVTANGTATLKYQWQFVSGLTSGNIAGATKSTYTITKVTPANAGSYRVVVSNAAGMLTSASALLTVNPSFAGKYNMAVISYNANDVANNFHVPDDESSGSTLYGTTSVTGASAPFPLAVSLTGYLGEDTGAKQTVQGSISSGGVVTINGTNSDLTVNMITGPIGTALAGVPIGFLGTGTPTPDTNNSNDVFIVGLNATTTAPTSAAACAGSYTMVVLSYNATAITKKKSSINDGDAQIGQAIVSSNGTVAINLRRYATGGDDTLGNTQSLTASVSSSGVISSVIVPSDSGPPVNRPVSIKFVTLNGLVIGFTGSFKPVSGQEDTGIILGIKNTSVSPLLPPPQVD